MEINLNVNGDPGTGNSFNDTKIRKVDNYNPNAREVNNYYTQSENRLGGWFRRLNEEVNNDIRLQKKLDDPKFIASWQKVKECLTCLDEDQVERTFSKEHASLLEFNQALAEELRLKEASLRSSVSALKADCDAVKNEISEIRAETKQLREERKLMEVEIEARKRQISILRSVRKTTT